MDAHLHFIVGLIGSWTEGGQALKTKSSSLLLTGLLCRPLVPCYPVGVAQVSNPGGLYYYLLFCIGSANLASSLGLVKSIEAICSPL